MDGAVKNFQKIVFLSWNGPPPTTAANKLLERSLDLRFGSRDKWDFCTRTTRKDKLKLHVTSKVIDRVNKIEGRLRFD